MNVDSDLVSVGAHTYGLPRILSWDQNTRVVIGKFCSIAEEVTIIAGGNHRIDWVTTYPLRILFNLPGGWQDGHPATKGDIVIGNDVWIGYGAILLSGIHIGDGAVIGAGAIVSRDVPPYAIVAGNPATVIRMRFTNAQITALRAIHWWDWPLDRILSHVDLLCDPNIERFLHLAAEFSASEPENVPNSTDSATQ